MCSFQSVTAEAALRTAVMKVPCCLIEYLGSEEGAYGVVDKCSHGDMPYFVTKLFIYIVLCHNM